MKSHLRRSLYHVLSLVLILGMVQGCTSLKEERRSDSRYTMDQDTGPEGEFDVSTVVEPEPSYEPPSRGGNKSPYQVWGKTYRVLDSAKGYEETGTASWYGRKFHGHKTSNGETYDMYQLTAAHRSLPLPTYLRVTNLENDRSTIVRVNDRGPFHSERVIDLSYAAARVLGFHGQGTANVHIEAVATSPEGEDRDSGNEARSTRDDGGVDDAGDEVMDEKKAESLFVQVGAFGSLSSATRLRDQLFLIASSNVHLVEASDLAREVHRVWVGPFDSRQDAEQEKDVIERNNLGQPIIISRPLDSAG